jgi:hypothetical protein
MRRAQKGIVISAILYALCILIFNNTRQGYARKSYPQIGGLLFSGKLK